MRLPSVKDLVVANKKVLLRTDYDVPLRFAQGKPTVVDDTRIKESLPTINYLLKQKAKVTIISHLGRPEGKVVLELSLKPVEKVLISLLHGRKVKLLENLRFDPREEKNDKRFARELASLADFYVNDAFAVSHRAHTSIVGIPQFLPSALGFDFLKEVEVLDKVRNNSCHPIVVILGGVKKDKLGVLGRLGEWADWILVGGKLPKLIANYSIFKLQIKKIIIAKLNEEGKDITLKSAQDFKKIINQAKTIVWAGPMGIFEDKRFEGGTKKIAQAVIDSGAYTVVGGGDTEAALTKFGLVNKVDYVSSGGGAMLEFLAKGTLSGIEAITKNF